MPAQFVPEECSLCFRALMPICMDLIGGRRIDIITIEAALIAVLCFPSCWWIIIIEARQGSWDWGAKGEWGRGLNRLMNWIFVFAHGNIKLEDVNLMKFHCSNSFEIFFNTQIYVLILLFLLPYCCENTEVASQRFENRWQQCHLAVRRWKTSISETFPSFQYKIITYLVHRILTLFYFGVDAKPLIMHPCI